jgi:hypothetical protein
LKEVGKMDEPIMVHDHALQVGDIVLAYHYMPDGKLSKQKRNYELTKLRPLTGLEQWAGEGEPRREWRLSRRGLELVSIKAR